MLSTHASSLLVVVVVELDTHHDIMQNAPLTYPSCCGCCPRMKLSGVSWWVVVLLAVVWFVITVITAGLGFFIFIIAAVMPALMVYIVYVRWMRKSLDSSFDDLFVRLFGAGFLPSMLIALVVEMAVSAILGLITIGPGLAFYFLTHESVNPDDPNNFGPSGPDMNALRSSPAWFIYLFLSSYLSVGLVEESIKAWAVRAVCCGCENNSAWCVQRRDYRQRQQVYGTVASFFAVSLGFAFSEICLGIIQTIFVVSVLGMWGSNVDQGALFVVLLLTFVRSLVTMPVHCVCASFTALRLSMRDAQKAKKEALMARAQVSSIHGSTGGNAIVVMADNVGGQQVYIPTAAVLSTPAPPPSTGAAQQEVAYASVGEMEDPSGVNVWSWKRVLWPAVLIHGTYDFVFQILITDMDDMGGRLVLILFLSILILVVSSVVLARQFGDAFENLAEGRVPEAITCKSKVWCMPCCTCDVLPSRGGNEAYGAGVVHDWSGASIAAAAAAVPQPPLAHMMAVGEGLPSGSPTSASPMQSMGAPSQQAWQPVPLQPHQSLRPPAQVVMYASAPHSEGDPMMHQQQQQQE